jgi:hypothetical protein
MAKPGAEILHTNGEILIMFSGSPTRAQQLAAARAVACGPNLQAAKAALRRCGFTVTVREARKCVGCEAFVMAGAPLCPMCGTPQPVIPTRPRPNVTIHVGPAEDGVLEWGFGDWTGVDPAVRQRAAEIAAEASTALFGDPVGVAAVLRAFGFDVAVVQAGGEGP